MIELTGLNGGKLLVGEKGVFRIRAATPSEGADATRVEYSGGYIFTHEAIGDLITRLSTWVRFAKLTTRGGSPVFLSVGAISRIREALPINGPGTEIVIGGLYQHVMETVAEVTASIQ